MCHEYEAWWWADRERAAKPKIVEPKPRVVAATPKPQREPVRAAPEEKIDDRELVPAE